LKVNLVFCWVLFSQQWGHPGVVPILVVAHHRVAGAISFLTQAIQRHRLFLAAVHQALKERLEG
jgi:hypothetical protein